MSLILISILMFGFVLPGSKIILNQGIPLSYFCVLYVGIRCVIQVPISIRNRFKNISSFSILSKLVTIGLVGALLQFCEFKSIELGILPPTVTFIIFSYPIWILLFNRNSPNHKFECLQSLLALVGLLFLLNGDFFSANFDVSVYIYAILASILIALWIVLTSNLRKSGVNATALSFFCDLFSFVSLLLIFQNSLNLDWSGFLVWSQHSPNIAMMVVYSIVTGLLPNLLFYQGGLKCGSHTLGLIMTAEPLLSTLYSALLWDFNLNADFFVGGPLILLANIPKHFYKKMLGHIEVTNAKLT